MKYVKMSGTVILDERVLARMTEFLIGMENYSIDRSPIGQKLTVRKNAFPKIEEVVRQAPKIKGRHLRQI